MSDDPGSAASADAAREDAVPVLRMAGIEKAFAGVPALRGAELVVGEAEIHALIGQNGAGKSTMIKILNGAYRRDAGTVELDGRAVAFRSPHEARLGGVSTIFQEVNLVGYRSVTENVVLGAEPRRFGMIDWRAAHRTARAAVERFGLDIDVRRPLHRFGIATQQLVAIARAVAVDARLVIMDEPTSSLDERETATLFEVMRSVRASGVSILYVSHYLEELFAVCDRVTTMRDGRTVDVRDIADADRLGLVSRMIGRDPDEVRARGATGFSAERDGRSGGETVLELESLSNGRNLHDASLVVHAGEIVGLAGLLGTGRSELAELAFGVEAPAAGRVRVGGVPVRFAAPADAIAAGIGFCTEDRKIDGIVPELSVRENLTLALLPRLATRGVVPPGAERDLVDRFIDRLGIKCAGPEQPVRELSGGNQQKVLLARWLATEPELLILDEPTRGIDVGAKHEIQRLIDALAREGMAILMISSELEELLEGADRVTVLQDGRTVAELDRDGLDERTLLAAIAAAPGAEGAGAAADGAGARG